MNGSFQPMPKRGGGSKRAEHHAARRQPAQDRERRRTAPARNRPDAGGTQGAPARPIKDEEPLGTTGGERVLSWLEHTMHPNLATTNASDGSSDRLVYCLFFFSEPDNCLNPHAELAAAKRLPL